MQGLGKEKMERMKKALVRQEKETKRIEKRIKRMIVEQGPQ